MLSERFKLFGAMTRCRWLCSTPRGPAPPWGRYIHMQVIRKNTSASFDHCRTSMLKEGLGITTLLPDPITAASRSQSKLRTKRGVSTGVSCTANYGIAMGCGCPLRKRRRLMLLVLVKVKSMLDLVSKALSIRRLGVSSVLLLVHIASTASLSHCQ